MEDYFEEWKEWFDTHKEPDGTINLSKHGDLERYLQNMYKPKKCNTEDLNKITGLGETVSFDLSSIKRSWEG